MKAFEVVGISKSFGDIKALSDVTLSAEQGTVFGLLGPNGAGKTTLVRLLSTLLRPDKGIASVLGHDVIKNPQQVREIIGLAGQFAAVDEYLTGRENLEMVGQLYHLDRKQARENAADILEQLALSEAADRIVKNYSGGMRRRLDLGACLVGRPEVLFLDEPTTGLDLRTRLELWNTIKVLVGGGTSIILTTQYLEEADILADKIAVIDSGKVIAEGTSSQLKKRLGGEVVEFEVENESDQAAALELMRSSLKQKPSKSEDILGVIVPVSNGAKDLFKVVELLNGAKISPKSISLHKPTLDDVFLSLTGKPTFIEKDEASSKKGKKR